MTETDAFAAFAAILILAHVLGAAIVISMRQRGYARRSARRSWRGPQLLRAWDFGRRADRSARAGTGTYLRSNSETINP